MMIRTFIALELPDNLKNKLIGIRDEFYTDRGIVKWEPENKLHLTLKFLGDTDENMIGNISGNIQKILEKYKSIPLSFTGFGVFKRDGQLKIFWAGFNENKLLSDLAKEIDRQCSQLGFKLENRNFKPHLTLLRIRGNEKIDLIYKIVNTKFEPTDFISDTITFYKSELKPSGSEYTVLEKFYLKKEQSNVK